MNIGALTAIMCANMTIQNSTRIQKQRREEGKTGSMYF